MPACAAPNPEDARRRACRPRRSLAVAGLLGASLLLLSVGGCGGSDGPDRERGGGDGQQSSTGRGDSEARTASTQRRDERCPSALPPGRFAASDVLQAVPRELRRVYRSIDRRDNHLYALFALDYREVAPGLRRSRYVRVAARACGKETANRSWVAIFSFPRAPFASFSPSVTFFARTEPGWHIWYEWYPNMRESGFPE
jgi:hypothetical protein